MRTGIWNCNVGKREDRQASHLRLLNLEALLPCLALSTTNYSLIAGPPYVNSETPSSARSRYPEFSCTEPPNRHSPRHSCCAGIEHSPWPFCSPSVTAYPVILVLVLPSFPPPRIACRQPSSPLRPADGVVCVLRCCASRSPRWGSLPCKSNMTVSFPSKPRRKAAQASD